MESPVEIAFKANFFQNSGEDWNNVNLSISNGTPSEKNIAPQLKPWFIRNERPYYDATPSGKVPLPAGTEIRGKVYENDTGSPVPGVAVLVKGTTIGTTTHWLLTDRN